MKRLFILTALLVLTASLTGCNCMRGTCFGRFFRGASYPPPAPTMIADPCNPCVPCNPCPPAGGPCDPAVPGPIQYTTPAG